MPSRPHPQFLRSGLCLSWPRRLERQSGGWSDPRFTAERGSVSDEGSAQPANSSLSNCLLSVFHTSSKQTPPLVRWLLCPCPDQQALRHTAGGCRGRRGEEVSVWDKVFIQSGQKLLETAPISYVFPVFFVQCILLLLWLPLRGGQMSHTKRLGHVIVSILGVYFEIEITTKTTRSPFCFF